MKFEIKDNITIDNNYDRILEKRYKDGKKIQLTYDAVGNLIGKTRINGGTSTTLYSYNDQDQLSSVKEDGLTIASYGYDHKRQRVYSNSPGAQTYDGQKIYYWDTQGRIIGEQNISYTGANSDLATVRYIYSGNQKVAMARPKDLNDIRAGEDIYYFVNNAQGTPVLIVDSAGKSVSKINLDEWGNPGTVEGSRAEINYTGKKLDPKTGLYYFNQRYYDPEIGRFLTEDPERQSYNPYLYCSNNPLTNIDPDGNFNFKALGVALKIVRPLTSAHFEALHMREIATIANSILGKINPLAGLASQAIFELIDYELTGDTSWFAEASLSFDNTPPVNLGDSGMGGDENSSLNELIVQGQKGLNRSVFAVEDGEVSEKGWQDESDHKRGFGYRIYIQTESGYEYVYGHMDSQNISSKIFEGAQVKKYQYIGQYANPTNGRSTGPHLHLGYRKIGSAVWLNPGNVFPLIGRYRQTSSWHSTDKVHLIPHSGVDYAYF